MNKYKITAIVLMFINLLLMICVVFSVLISKAEAQTYLQIDSVEQLSLSTPIRTNVPADTPFILRGFFDDLPKAVIDYCPSDLECSPDGEVINIKRKPVINQGFTNTTDEVTPITPTPMFITNEPVVQPQIPEEEPKMYEVSLIRLSSVDAEDVPHWTSYFESLLSFSLEQRASNFTANISSSVFKIFGDRVTKSERVTYYKFTCRSAVVCGNNNKITRAYESSSALSSNTSFLNVDDGLTFEYLNQAVAVRDKVCDISSRDTYCKAVDVVAKIGDCVTSYAMIDTIKSRTKKSNESVFYYVCVAMLD